MLETTLKLLPNSAGVYKFFDIDGQLLYVGKAKILKNRVKSYFRFTPLLSPAHNLSPRIAKMISEARKLEYIVSSNEYDALILENSLIKELKPKYNILLRDDKTYPYISLDLRDEFPRFEITRKVQKHPKLKYFGPFSSGARDILDAIYLCYKLVQKKNCLREKKACLFHQIDKCHAPCEKRISQEAYLQIVQEAKNAIIDRKKLILKLQEKMLQASMMLNFEEAAKLRDMQEGIKNTLHVIELDLAKIEDFDLVAIHSENNIASIVFLFIREGKVVSNITKTLKNSLEFEQDELYKRAILQFYKTNPEQLPKTLYSAHDFEGKDDVILYFQNSYEKNIQIKTPLKGEKLSLCNTALTNAKESLKNYKLMHKEDISKEIQSFFNLQKLPVRIETFDNSHHGGSAPIGAMVTYEEKFVKEDYRIYNLHVKDEYSQMKEMLERRIEKFSENPAPDLWVLDGGKTLLNLAKKLLDEAHISIDLLAIAKEKRDAKAQRAKGKANDIIHSLAYEYKLPTSDKKLQFLQKLRDEAHRFAIKSHRNKKQKDDMQGDISQVENIGPSTLKKLLAYFGSFEKIYEASQNELENLIGKQKASSLYKFINR